MSEKSCPLACVKNAKLMSIFTAGILAGENYAINLYVLPLLKEVKDKEEKKKMYLELYRKGKNVALVSTALLGGTLLYLYKKTQDRGYLCPLSLTLLKVPVSLCCMNACPEDNGDIDEFGGH